MNTFTQEQVEAFRLHLERIAEHQGSAIAVLAADRAARDLDALARPPGRRFSLLRRLGRRIAALSADQPGVEEMPDTQTVVIIDATYRVIEPDHEASARPAVEVLP